MDTRELATRWEEQCGAITPVPPELKGQFEYMMCALKAGHEGTHMTTDAYGSIEW